MTRFHVTAESGLRLLLTAVRDCRLNVDEAMQYFEDDADAQASDAALAEHRVVEALKRTRRWFIETGRSPDSFAYIDEALKPYEENPK